MRVEDAEHAETTPETRAKTVAYHVASGTHRNCSSCCLFAQHVAARIVFADGIGRSQTLAGERVLERLVRSVRAGLGKVLWVGGPAWLLGWRLASGTLRLRQARPTPHPNARVPRADPALATTLNEEPLQHCARRRAPCATRAGREPRCARR